MESKKEIRSKKSKYAISLIVLVITIIVMIVLAGAIILSLNNTGIIGKANQAVKDTDEVTVKELAQMAWGEAYAEGIRRVESKENEEGTKVSGLEERVKTKLDNNGINLDDYGIVVTIKGVTIKKGWLKNGFEIVKGDKTLRIGDVVKYNAGVNGYTGGWKILGSDEDGNILIMSTIDVARKTLGDMTVGSDIKKSQQDRLNVKTILDKECEEYGQGDGAIGTRSVTVEDINMITGYEPTGYGKGLVYQYGNEVTYAWDTTDKNNIKLKYSGTLNGTAGSTNYPYSLFTWYDEKTGTFPVVNKGIITTPLPKIKNTYYGYTAKNLATMSSDESSRAYSMLFGEDDKAYWLASSFVMTKADGVTFGLRCVSKGKVSSYDMWMSSGGSGAAVDGVRAVVTLQSNITLSGSSEAGWNYTVK